MTDESFNAFLDKLKGYPKKEKPITEEIPIIGSSENGSVLSPNEAEST